ncbi:hypothetical protein [Chryseolinea soli]|uniref:Uncharacterized protein n=1 Tax=Chryseolinea soli TaxID=2321403 RepID=A0A385SJE3_9BACT|nr:hypothetical protein [Chryseolinea soli]AYB29128.1 hypothetical protein D4L85_00370 [Chryseolinea soli]
MNYTWTDFDNGKSIRQTGSEGGTILRDEENTFGARVTLEGKGDVAPFSITIGIYGLLFHTEFFLDLAQAQKCFDLFKRKIEDIIHHYSISEDRREAEWNKKHDKLIEEILHVD